MDVGHNPLNTVNISMSHQRFKGHGKKTSILFKLNIKCPFFNPASPAFGNSILWLWQLLSGLYIVWRKSLDTICNHNILKCYIINQLWIFRSVWKNKIFFLNGKATLELADHYHGVWGWLPYYSISSLWRHISLVYLITLHR